LINFIERLVTSFEMRIQNSSVDVAF
jgi:hypothetical protein